MYPRLKLLHKLLRDDGVIFISIDDNEQANLKLMMDEIFGKINDICTFSWEKHIAPKSDNKYITTNHEYIFCYAKEKNKFSRNLLPRSEKNNSIYKNPDQDIRGNRTS